MEISGFLATVSMEARMSDRLRSLNSLGDIEFAVKRIEELEAKLVRYDDLVADKINLRAENVELKAKLAKAVAFLQDQTGAEWPYDEGAKRILAELTGGNDE
jgi:hypothetical protein